MQIDHMARQPAQREIDRRGLCGRRTERAHGVGAGCALETRSPLSVVARRIDQPKRPWSVPQTFEACRGGPLLAKVSWILYGSHKLTGFRFSRCVFGISASPCALDPPRFGGIVQALHSSDPHEEKCESLLPPGNESLHLPVPAAIGRQPHREGLVPGQIAREAGVQSYFPNPL